ncbi:hypothetical protein HBI54_037060 [Parastagonospora nodorum]|nr:hypothetical protein HBI54_037060 [Parastagonospora nodorum]
MAGAPSSKGRERAMNKYLSTKSHLIASRVVKGPPALTPNTQSLAIARRNQQSSRLLRLPPELRNRIYELAMETHNPALHTTDLAWERLSLSRTCHQIFAETAMRYHVVKLLPIANMVHHMCHLHRDLHVVKLLAPSQRRAIRAFEVGWEHAAVLLQTRCKVRDLTGVRRVVVKGVPRRMTRSVGVKMMRLRQWIEKGGFVIEMEEGV